MLCGPTRKRWMRVRVCAPDLATLATFAVWAHRTMVKLLVLRTDGTLGEEAPRKASLELLQARVGGNITYLPQRGKRAPGCRAVASDDAMGQQRPTNAWSAVLATLGFTVPWVLGGVWGDVVLVPSGSGPLPPPVVALCQRCVALRDSRADDADEQFEALLAHYAKHGALPGAGATPSPPPPPPDPAPDAEPLPAPSPSKRARTE